MVNISIIPYHTINHSSRSNQQRRCDITGDSPELRSCWRLAMAMRSKASHCMGLHSGVSSCCNSWVQRVMGSNWKESHGW